MLEELDSSQIEHDKTKDVALSFEDVSLSWSKDPEEIALEKYLNKSIKYQITQLERPLRF